ncbi:MAG: M13 family metallopeptidase [Alphaproteobacteria bacterium]|nr:M13 family metallopeptidase [Alphaproteobacteria bacterium]
MKNTFLNILGIVCVIAAIFFAYNYKKEEKMNIGIKYENMDMTKKPGDDFYDYTTLGWRKLNPLPDDYTRYGAFTKLENTNLERVREIAESDNGKIGTLYKIAMNSERLNADKTAPVKPYLDEIDNIKSRNDLAQYLGNAHKNVSGAFWGDGVSLDEKDSDHFIYNIGQGGIGISRDYFFDTDTKSQEIRKQYREYIGKIMKKFGIAVDVEKLYNLEERMAKSFFKKELLRDPHANYHKMTIDEVKEKFSGFDWDAYLTARGATAAKVININQPSAITESIAIMNDTDLDLIKTYLKYRVISSATSLLDDETYDIAFDFYNRKMAGQPEPKPRWKRAISLINGSIGEEIGRLYVKKYFPASAKKRMEQLVENLRRAYEIRIKNLDWMSDETKAQALEKLHSFKAKIGYPDKWRDYSKLVIDAKDSLFDNMVRVSEFEDKFWIDKIGKEKDPTIWYMNAHEVNAYYASSTNEICFPAGILQPPFFDMEADDAFNYGAIGCTIGHEMTHGFDDEGRNFDKDGNMRDWWTPNDAKGFTARANVMRDFFNGIKITDEVNANGEFTLGENLADYGGVTIAYTAYKNFGTPSETVNGLTPDMRFFIAYGGVWAGNIRDAEVLRLTKVDVHSLARNRVNGILPHIDAWYDAFGIKESDKLYITPEKRVKLW